MALTLWINPTKISAPHWPQGMLAPTRTPSCKHTLLTCAHCLGEVVTQHPMQYSHRHRQVEKIRSRACPNSVSAILWPSSLEIIFKVTVQVPWLNTWHQWQASNLWSRMVVATVHACSSLSLHWSHWLFQCYRMCLACWSTTACPFLD